MDASLVNHLLMPRAAQQSETPAQQFLNLVSDPFRSQLQGQAFITSLATALGATVIVAALFCLLRPYNSVVYAPRLRHADEKHAPPTLGKGPFAWVSPVVKTKEQLLVEKIGMDATIFIRFTCMCRNMFLVLTVVGCGILIPTYVIGGKQFNSGANISAFMKMTPQFLVGTIFWGIVACAWLMNLIVIIFLWFNYRAVTKLRRHYFESPEYQTALHSRTLMVTGIPKSMITDEGVVRVVDSVQNSGVIPRGAIGRNVKELPDLIEEHDKLVRQLEIVLAKYLKNPDKLPINRPTCKASDKDLDYQRGTKVDAIEYLTARIQKLENKVKETRATLDQRNAMNYGFASYSTVEEAHSVAYAARRKHPHGATVTLAPRPSDIIWRNLPLNKASITTRSIINNLWVALLTLVWIAPNAMIAIFLANLGNLGLIWPAFNANLQRNTKSWAVVQGVLAPALTSLFYWVLPMIFRRLAMNAGDKTKTSRDKHVTSKLYAFFVFNNLIVFSLFSAVWQFIAAVINARERNQDALRAIRTGDLWTKLLIALCNVSPFWASWLLQRNLGAAIDLAQIANLAWGSFQRRFLSPTPRELIELSAPPPFDYASYYNYFLFYSTIALCFATIQPVVLPIAAFYFCLDAWLKKYLLMYVFTTKNESGGRFWRILFNRLLFAIFLSDVVVAAMIYARRGGTGDAWKIMLATMIPMPVIIIAFKFYCKRAFDGQCEYFSRGNLKEEAMLSDDKSIRSDRIKLRFGHPAMYKPLLTPMVHAKSQHLLAKIYSGRLDDDEDDMASLAGYSDTYSMRNIARNHQRKTSKALKNSPFEFVDEKDMDFENFKNRADFKHEHGGDGEMYGRAEDASSRSGTPGGFRPGEAAPSRTTTFDSVSRPPMSNLRSVSSDSESNNNGTHYARGYNQALNPSRARNYSPSPDAYDSRSTRAQNTTLLHGAAPMGDGQDPISRSTTPGAPISRGRQF